MDDIKENQFFLLIGLKKIIFAVLNKNNQILLNNTPFLFTIPLIKASQNRKINQHIIMNGWSKELHKTLKHA